MAPDLRSDQAEELRRLGAKPVLYALNRAGMNVLKELMSIVSICTALKREKPDILFCFQIKPAIYGSICAIFNQIKTVLIMIEGLGYVFSRETAANRLLRAFLKSLLKISFKKAKRIFFLNRDDKDELVNHSIISREKAIVLGGLASTLRNETMLILKVIPFLLYLSVDF